MTTLVPWRAASLERQRLGDGRRAQEAHRLHGEVGGAIAAGLRDPAQKFPTGAAHLDLALLPSVTPRGLFDLHDHLDLDSARCREVPPCRRRSGRACRSPRRRPRPSDRKIRSPPWAGRRKPSAELTMPSTLTMRLTRSSRAERGPYLAEHDEAGLPRRLVALLDGEVLADLALERPLPARRIAGEKQQLPGLHRR